MVYQGSEVVEKSEIAHKGYKIGFFMRKNIRFNNIYRDTFLYQGYEEK